MRPGDLVLYKVVPQSAIHSKLIGWFQVLLKKGTSSTLYSHISILQDSTHEIEAVFPKVHIHQVDWTDSTIEVWTIPSASDQQALNAVARAQTYVGRWYNIFFGLLPLCHTEDCSQLVARSWKAQGIDFDPGDKSVSPDEIVSSGLLQRIK